MTTVAVLCEPPLESRVLPALSGSVLAPADALDLYRAMLADVCYAVQDSGAELLVNYRESPEPPDDESAGEDTGIDPEAELRDMLAPLLPEPTAARYEPQVGQTFSGRVGNSITHLLESEGVTTAAALTPAAAFLARQHLGNGAMKLRSSDVVLGPAPGGRVYFAGFGEPVDFEAAYDPPAVRTLTEKGLEADLDVDFLPMLPLVESEADLAAAVVRLEARESAERTVPAATASVLGDLALEVGRSDGELCIARSDNS